MDNRDCGCVAHTLAKATVEPGIHAATLKQCIYRIGLVLAGDDALWFDLGTWRGLIDEHRDYLELAAEKASFTRDCLVAAGETGNAPASGDPLPHACAQARRDHLKIRPYSGEDGADG